LTQHDAPLRIEHVEALRHVVEGIGHALDLPSQAMMQHTQAGDERNAEGTEKGPPCADGQDRCRHAGSLINSSCTIEHRPLRYG